MFAGVSLTGRPLVQTLVSRPSASYSSVVTMPFWSVEVSVRPRVGSRVCDVTWSVVTVVPALS